MNDVGLRANVDVDRPHLGRRRRPRARLRRADRAARPRQRHDVLAVPELRAARRHLPDATATPSTRAANVSARYTHRRDARRRCAAAATGATRATASAPTSSAQHVFETRYVASVRTGVWQWDDKLAPDRDATSFNYVLGVGYRFAPRAQAHVRVGARHEPARRAALPPDALADRGGDANERLALVALAAALRSSHAGGRARWPWPRRPPVAPRPRAAARTTSRCPARMLPPGRPTTRRRAERRHLPAAAHHCASTTRSTSARTSAPPARPATARAYTQPLRRKTRSSRRATTCDACHSTDHSNLDAVKPGDDATGQCAFCHLGYKAGDGNAVAALADAARRTWSSTTRRTSTGTSAARSATAPSTSSSSRRATSCRACAAASAATRWPTRRRAATAKSACDTCHLRGDAAAARAHQDDVRERHARRRRAGCTTPSTRPTSSSATSRSPPTTRSSAPTATRKTSAPTATTAACARAASTRTTT